MIKISEKKLQDKYKEETGKNAIWRGKETKSYLEWKNSQGKGGLSEEKVKAIADEVFGV